MARKSKLSTQEALQILNLQKSEMKPDVIQKVRPKKPAGAGNPPSGNACASLATKTRVAVSPSSPDGPCLTPGVGHLADVTLALGGHSTEARVSLGEQPFLVVDLK